MRRDTYYNRAIKQQFDTQDLCGQASFITMPLGAASGLRDYPIKTAGLVTPTGKEGAV